MGDPKIYLCDGVRICELCMAGKGGECHSPGCVLWLRRAPDLEMFGIIKAMGGEIYDERAYAEMKGWHKEDSRSG